MSKNYKIMVDVVLNHGSRKSKWFKNFLNNKGEGKNFYFYLNKILMFLMLSEQDLINYYKRFLQKMVLNMYGVLLVLTKLILIIETLKFF